MKQSLLLLMCVGWPFIVQAQPSESVATDLQPTRQTYLRLAAEVTHALHADVLDAWFRVRWTPSSVVFIPILGSTGKNCRVTENSPYFRGA